MYQAEVGDDVFGEDPTVNRLQEMAAELAGKEAALLVTSGTQGNLVGVLSHTYRGDEVIVGAEAHVFVYEVAGAAVVGGLQMRTVSDEKGWPEPALVAAAIRDENIHFPRTGLVCLENTHNRRGGAVVPLEAMREVSKAAHQRGVPVHVDGARIFNASVYLGLPVRDLVADADSVTFCLSKGLSAPVGSLLCGSREYIARARRYRKMLGGGMRQAGVLAAAGIVALTQMVDRLAEDHANAQLLAKGLANIDRIRIDPAKTQTNIVVFEVDPALMSRAAFLSRLKDEGVLATMGMGNLVRMVTHYGIEAADIQAALAAVARVLKS